VWNFIKKICSLYWANQEAAKDDVMSSVSQKLDEMIHELAVETIVSEGRSSADSSDSLKRLRALGTEPWVDTGDLEKARSVWKEEMGALTTNNTLANQVVQSGVMDDVILQTVKKLKDVGLSDDEQVAEIGFVINCKIALRLVQAFKVQVSVELHPSLSRNIEKTLATARRYYRVCPEYFIIKIPLTPEGYLAVRQLRAEGLPVNFTLGFSARQNYLAARLSNPTFLNVFLGRLNQVVAENELGSGDGVGEKVTLATQQAMTEVRTRFADVSSRLIAASIRGGKQVAFLAGVDVLTIPPAALEEYYAYAESGEEIISHIGENVTANIDPEGAGRFASLWEVSDSFKQFVDALTASPALDEMTGNQMRSFCRQQGIDLFHDFSADDYRKITDKGKIPCLNDWPEQVALDDLMTQSALMSFTKDQNALDERIRSFLHG
jgi:transaldolase